MTPQEKAKELIDKFLMEVRGADRYCYNLDSMNIFIAKQCALIAVREIQNLKSVYHYETLSNYWESVEHELSNSNQTLQ